jgi:hypothetical protein
MGCERLTGRGYPAPDGDISNGHLAADNVAGLLLGEMSVESAVQTTSFVGVAVDTVLNLLGSVALEVVGLALHRTKTTHLPHEPAGHLPMLSRALRERELVILVIAINEVLQHSTTLKDTNLLAVECISESRDATVGVDLEEPLFLLLIFGHLDGVHLVLEVELLEQNGGLDAIGSVGGVEGDVGLDLLSHVEELFA